MVGFALVLEGLVVGGVTDAFLDLADHLVGVVLDVVIDTHALFLPRWHRATTSLRPSGVDIEVVPLASNGNTDDSIICKAVEKIQTSKLKHEVHAMGTTVEGAGSFPLTIPLPFDLKSLLSSVIVIFEDSLL